MILLSVPFWFDWRVWGVWLADFHFSSRLSSVFIALCGIAVETAIVMLIYIDHEMRDHPPVSYDGLLDNVRRRALHRLRPKLMTVATILWGWYQFFDGRRRRGCDAADCAAYVGGWSVRPS